MIRTLLLTLLLAAPASAQAYFGYSGTICGLDAPGEDFAAQVAPYSNIAHVCPTGDIATNAANLAHAYELGMTPLFHVQELLFQPGYRSTLRRRTMDLWRAAVQAIAQSGVPTTDLILYIADQPSMGSGYSWDAFQVMRFIQRDLPGVRTMVIDTIPSRNRLQQVWPHVDYWGLHVPALLDPMADDAFMERVTFIEQRMRPDQRWVFVMDATFTDAHAEAGLTPADMADVARNYATLAATIPDVDILLVDAWPSGVDESALGAWELPPEVVATHEAIGLRITRR